MSYTLTNTTLGPGVVDATEINENFADVVAVLDGNITNANISASAGIALSKLAASYEYMTVPLVHVGDSTWDAAGTVFAATPIYNDGKGTWTAVAYSWYTNDVGAQTAAFDLLWTYYETTGSLNASPTVIKDAEVFDGGTANSAFNDGATCSVSLPWTVDRMMLVGRVDTDEATFVSTAYDQVIITVTLKRQIAT